MQDVLIRKERQKDFVKENCGCYYNNANGKWEVVVGVGLTDNEEAERFLFSEPADACCYYELMQVFGKKPAKRSEEQNDMAELAETA